MQLSEEQIYLIAIGVAIGLVLGLLIASIIAVRKLGALRTDSAVLKTQLKDQQELHAEREEALEMASAQLTHTFDQLAHRTLRSNSESFLQLAKENLGRFQTQADAGLAARHKAVEHLVKPMAKALEETKQQIAKVEQERHQAFGGIVQQLKQMNQAQQLLQTETANLVGALKRPEVRGRWGEITLRRLVEIAGMVEHCDFAEQVHTKTEDGAMRPDMIVNLPEDRILVVDVKTPLDAYLSAVEAKDDASKKTALERHTRQVRERVRELGSKAYWRQFPTSPDFIILFLPGDQFLSAALAVEPELLDNALQQKIILATPSNLMALLKTVSYGWRQVSLAKNAEHIRDLGETLYKRMATFTEHLAKMGNTLGGTVDAYNRAVGSLERQVMPGARKFTELGIRETKALAKLEPIEKKTREPDTTTAKSIASPDTTSKDKH